MSALTRSTGRRAMLSSSAAKRRDGQFVELIAIPVAIHVGLAETELAVCQHSGEEPFVVHANVPRALASDSDVCLREQGLDGGTMATRGQRRCARAIAAVVVRCGMSVSVAGLRLARAITSGDARFRSEARRTSASAPTSHFVGS